MNALLPAALAKVRQQANVGVMGDAFYDEAFCRALVRGDRRGPRAADRRGPAAVQADGRVQRRAASISTRWPSRAPERASSNTVVTFDETLFLKGYRRLRDGVNPELEMGRFLTDVARFANCVPVLGALEYVGNDGRVDDAGAGAGASSPTRATAGTTRSATSSASSKPCASGDDVGRPSDAHGGFLALVATLGERTAELHLALARRTGDPAFDPEPLPGERPGGVSPARRGDEMAATLALLRERAWRSCLRPRAATPRPCSGAARPRARVAGAAAKVGDGAASAAAGRGLKTRYHGDYHLGQVLVTGNDFVIIDFEGEPARSFDERRAKGSPLRDVAGMLRSFNYARWSALRRARTNAEELARLGPALREWERRRAPPSSTAYAQAAAGAPSAAAVDADLLALFELEKAMYELRYELNNRVDWVQVPLQGILAWPTRAPTAEPAATAPDTTSQGERIMESVDILLEPARAILFQIGAFLPRLLIAVVVVIVGWLVAKVARFAVDQGAARDQLQRPDRARRSRQLPAPGRRRRRHDDDLRLARLLAGHPGGAARSPSTAWA